MARQLAVSRESERNFLLSVSHELKTPLTAIRGYAEGLGEGAFTTEEASRTILVEARRLERLVRDLLDLARMRRSEFSVQREPVDLGAVARQAVAPARGRGARVRGRRSPPSRASPGSRPTTTGCSRSRRTWSRTPCARRRARGRWSSAPRGRSWPWPTRARASSPADLPHAFDRFFLYDKYGRERPVGSGLGLAIVKQLAEAMGGRVSVESAPGRGTVFRLTLPSGPKPRRVDDLEVGAVQAT